MTNLLPLVVTTLMVRVRLATILDPDTTMSIRDGVGKCAAVELMGRSDNGPILLMLLTWC
jgi:hypothetical protein